jgi:Tol biopolymer transport system component/predicted Ser/Thr protein kinase
MVIASGTRLGPYEIVAPIGAGGMGEVWRGRDTRLDRSVAIKIVAPEFAKRFEREAKSISALNHPHICTLYDVGPNYLVMELLEGESLADKLAKGPLPLDQVLRYGIEIADALDKAHRAGIIHRDLKPGNIMITKSGAKLLDFGLARSTAIIPDDKTQQKPVTQEGTIVGTFQYMAPEQIEGAEVDARTDIFALGAVLYEMATGKRAFDGKTKTSVIAAIVSGEPKPMSQVQPLTPAAFERVVKKCLAKEPDARWQCAADLRSQLQEVPDAPEVARPRPSSRLPWAIAAAALVAAAILGVVAYRPKPPQPPVRFTVSAPPGWTYGVNYNLGPPAISPDGRYLAFPAAEDATGRVMLWVRDLRATEPFMLAGTDGAGFPFWSPDSKSVGFFAGSYLKRIDVGGGAPQVLCPAAFGRGGSWSSGNEIIFAPSGNEPLFRIPASGGTARALTHLNKARNEVSHRWPYFLPDGKHFLYMIRTPAKEDQSGEAIFVSSLDADAPRMLLNLSTNVAYADPGSLIFMRDRTLMVQRFNPRTLVLEGEPHAVTTERLQYHASGFGLFAVSRNGVMTFSSGSLASTPQWIDRSGRAEAAFPVPGNYLEPRLSPDRQRILYSLPDAISGTLDIWLFDITRRVARRLTFNARDDFSGVLTPDGKQLVYCSNRFGFPALMMKPLDGTEERLLLKPSGIAEFPESISRDGRFVLFRRITAGMQNDLLFLRIGDPAATPFAASPFNEIQPVFSPSGRWVAFVTNESGRYQVYVSHFPDGLGRVQISADGGTQPTWRDDEKELFYVAPGGRMIAVPIDGTGSAVKPGMPMDLFSVSLTLPSNEEREYDVRGDGKRFLVNTVAPDKRSIPLTVVVNWQ